MDRLQYARGPVDSYKPYDLACKKKPAPAYALLADLQTIVPGKGSSATPTRQQSPATHHQHLNGSANSHVYGNIKTHEQPLTNGHSMYHHETVEEVRTEHSSSGPNPSSAKMSINNNLSELDTLIHDLNTARYTGTFKENNGPSVNGTRPNVQTLLDELNCVGNGDEGVNYSMQHVKTVSETSTTQKGPSASNATRELDDLMASLSDFKVKDGQKPRVKEQHTDVVLESKVSHALDPEVPKVAVMTEHHNRSHRGLNVDETILPHTTKKEHLQSPALVRKLINASNLQSQVDTYAKPQKPKTPSPPKEPTPPPILDSMLVDLTSHMTEQGITTTQKGCCCACSKPIVGQVITALGKTWHPEHFLCAHCNEELGTRNFFERDGKPYCEPDYHNLFSPRCAYCDGPILDKCVTALDKTWHPEHFFCAQCGNTFGEDGFHEKDGKPYCKEDYFNMFAPKCGGCNSPIMENYISALNAQWHPECFVCRDCKGDLRTKQYYDIDGKPVCSACLGVSDDEEEEDE